MGKQGSRRARARWRQWTAEEARRALEAWRVSGLPLATFARRRGLCAERVRWWRLRVSDWQRAPGEERPQLAPAVVTGLPLVPAARGQRGNGARPRRRGGGDRGRRCGPRELAERARDRAREAGSMMFLPSRGRRTTFVGTGAPGRPSFSTALRTSSRTFWRRTAADPRLTPETGETARPQYVGRLSVKPAEGCDPADGHVRGYVLRGEGDAWVQLAPQFHNGERVNTDLLKPMHGLRVG